MKLAAFHRRESSLPNLTLGTPKNKKEAEYQKRFTDNFSADAFGQYRGASSWEVAYDAASHFGAIDSRDFVAVINSYQGGRYCRALRGSAEEQSAVQGPDLNGLGVDAAREFYFKSMSVKLSHEQAEKLMNCDIETLMQSISYYTLPLPWRCVVTCLGRSPKLGALAYIGEYF